MSCVQSVQSQVDPDSIHLGIGHPGSELLPLELMHQAAAHRLGQPDNSLLQYGLEAGDGYFRLALADFLGQHYGEPVEMDQLFITAGASQALDLICTQFTRAGDLIFVEEPSYLYALGIFANYDLQVVSLPIDQDGLVIEALEEKLATLHPTFLYTIPTFQNPTGYTLSAARRQRLVELSQEYKFLIVADEVYHLLNYQKLDHSQKIPRPLASYTESGTVLSVNSFSKILAPGLRLGWIQTSPTRCEELAQNGLVVSGGGLNHFTTGLVRSALELGLQERHLARLKAVYSERTLAMQRAIQQHLPNYATFAEPAGGFFLWLQLPEEIDTEELWHRAQAHKVSFQPGTHFSSRQGLRNYLRLSFSYYDSPELEEGIIRLADALAETPLR